MSVYMRGSRTALGGMGLRRGRVRWQRRANTTTIVAPARKLVGIMFAVWRDGTEFDPLLPRVGGGSAT
jgi:hypothetical protein